MRRFILNAVFALTIGLPGCQRNGTPEALGNDPCKGVKDPHVCVVPFEVIYSHREVLEDRFISVDGALVAGFKEEPPGRKHREFLLFPSIERARVCNVEVSIELIPGSADWARELELNNGRIVHVAGRLRRNSPGHWAALEIGLDPSVASARSEETECLTEIPPGPPHP